MKIGMIWFDNNPKLSLEQKISQATQYYTNKYGSSPNLIYTHPGAESVQIAGLRVEKFSSVLPHHLWIGVAE